MKKTLILYLIIFPTIMFGQGFRSIADSEQDKKIDSLIIVNENLTNQNILLQNKIESLDKRLNILSKKTKNSINEITLNFDSLKFNNNEIISDLKQRISVKASSQEVNDLIKFQSKELLSEIEKQGKIVLKNSDDLNTFNSEVSSIEADLDSQEELVLTNKTELSKNNQYVLISLILGSIVLVICVIIYFLTSKNKRKITNTNDEIQKFVDLDNSFKNLFEKHLSLIEKLAKNPNGDDVNLQEENTKQVKMVADEIATMENNIFYMDPKDGGVKRIVRAIRNMRNNYQTMGYTIPVLLGKEYVEGDILEINSEVYDENIEEGKRIITRVITPRIDYNGKMIQRAKVEIKNNI